MDEIIKTDLKTWLSWKTDDYHHCEYIRVYVNQEKPDTIALLRHIEEHKKIRNGEIKKIDYSIITEVPGRFNSCGSWSGDEYNDEVKMINKSPGLFHLHHGDAYTLESYLELFLAKKGTDIRIEYWPFNCSDFLKSKNLRKETIIFSFHEKGDYHKREFKIQLDNIPNGPFTRLYGEMDLGYVQELGKIISPSIPAEV